MSKQELAQQLRNLRLQNGWTQKELAERADSSLQYISQIERGIFMPSVTLLEKLADVFDKELEINLK